MDENKANVFLFLSFGIIENDGRSIELINSLNKVGKTIKLGITRDEKKANYDIDSKYLFIGNKKYLSLINYIKFTFFSISTYFKHRKEIDVLFVDNFLSSIPAMILIMIFRPKVVIQDRRELYFSKEMKNNSGKIMCYLEEKISKKANLVIVANKFRQKILDSFFEGKVSLFTYENIRFLPKNENKFDYYEKKYQNIFKDDSRTLISTGGISFQRMVDKLISDFEKVKTPVKLILVGGGPKDDVNRLKKLINKGQKSMDIYLIDKVSMDELRFLIKKSDVGIVNYHQKDLNNLYCASGKVYEYLEEGKPIITTENIPLKEFCKVHDVGIASNDFNKSIDLIFKDYSKFQKNVYLKKGSFSPIINNESLANEVRKYV